ncbi:MAG: metallophosphoesterase [Clostridia bacterium]|nr:metallophosphoesterase [Clostridia bacterium]
MKSLKEREWFFSQEKEEFPCTNPDTHYDVYRLKSTRQVICDIEVISGLPGEPVTIGVTADLHFNFCNMEDRADEELAYTEQCRHWLENQKSVVAAVKALEAADYCDAAVVVGDTLDYLSRGAISLTKTHLIKKYPDIMMALGGHDYTKQMQTKRPDLLPLSERLDMLRAFWPHDIHYYSRDIKERVIAVILDNSQSKYLPGQAELLTADIERARREGKVIVIFQHEPITPRNPEYAKISANIVNGGAISTVDFGAAADVVGDIRTSNADTLAVYELITSNADVVKAIVCGHWHSQFYTDVTASYKDGEKNVQTVIPQYIISGNPYHEAGFVARITVK